MPETKDIILGSGLLYCVAFQDELPTNTEIEIDANLIGTIKGGASIEYKPTVIEIDDDNYQTIARFVTKEEVTFKSGVLKWNLDNLAQLSNGALTDDAATGLRTLKIGGKGARKMNSYVLHFCHTKQDGKKVRATLVGTPSNGFSLVFDPQKETVIDAEFKAMPSDTAGVLLMYSIEYAVAGG